jgi:hypothetical protein
MFLGLTASTNRALQYVYMFLKLKSLTLNHTVQVNLLLRHYLHFLKVSLIYIVHWAQNMAGSRDTEEISTPFKMTATKHVSSFFS